MKNCFKFGEDVKGYKIPVLNEREARAGAGILLLGAMFSFSNAFLTGDMYFTQIFIIIFMIDFLIRVINPKYAPSLIMGRFAVNNQVPEYVGAAQKRFAWALGLGLGSFMFFAMILSAGQIPCLGPLCILCLILLFFESSFGICLGCKMYNTFSKDKAQLCPGGTCELNKKEEIQKINFSQIFIIVLLFGFIFSIVKFDMIKGNENITCNLGGKTCGENTKAESYYNN